MSARVLLGALVAVVGVGALLAARGPVASGSAGPRHRTAAVEVGDLVAKVEANGTVQPRVLVQVGTQISGVIEELRKDFNDQVRAGETIAVLDSRRLVTQVLQDEAALGQARADLARVEALAHQGERSLARTQQLAARLLVSDSEVDAALANAGSLRAQVDLAAAIVSSNLARLEGDRVNLRLATIVSPVDGVVVSRSVDVGQTVAAALQAPILFQIAGDLKVVQVQASVPEADVGRLRRGMPAVFTVDAHPDASFEATVSQVRLAASTIDNVVTYTVLVDSANDQELLMPGMTATVAFEVARAAGATLVPVAALRFTPVGQVRGESGRVFVERSDGGVETVDVEVGLSDGVRVAVTALAGATLGPGARVIVGAPVVEEDSPARALPFAPPGTTRKRAP